MTTRDTQQVNAWNSQVIDQFRTNGGQLSGAYAETTLLLLTTVGKKSGQPRIAPLAYKRDGEHLIIVASFMGAPKHPDWYLNLVAQPEVTVEVGTERFQAIASTITGPERERLLEEWPMIKEHQAKTTREIPVVALQRVK